MESATGIGIGLTEIEARSRLAEYGYNEIPEEPPRPLLGVFKRLWGPIPWILEAALVLEVVLGNLIEASIIAVLLAFSAVVGETQELRARKALGYLRSHLQVTARVRRENHWMSLPAREVVPGDVIHVGPGDIVPADCDITEGTVEVDQAVLTGESSVVSRTMGETLYSGSTIHHGEVTGTVIATGSRSYFGRTAELVKTAKSPGHLEQLLFTVVRYLATLDAILAVVIIAAAIVTGIELLPLLPFILVLVIATVPVSMPASFTVANAVEARTLAKSGILVTGLTAIQEVGTMEILCVDKTGTLTQNRQVIAVVVPVADETEEEVLTWAASACDESIQNPLNLSILRELERRSLQPLERLDCVPFDPAKKRSEARVLRGNQEYKVILGAPKIVEQFTGPIMDVMEKVEELSSSGQRVLAVAAGKEDRMTLRGLIGFADLPREDASKFISSLKNLGIRIMMVTGDSLTTARAISKTLGLGDRIGEFDKAIGNPIEYDGIADVYPENKFQIVKAMQDSRLVTGMTGDGVNDAPALKQAEVGIAVSSASDVAKASAKVVLTRPGLQDIVEVVLGGRRVYRRMLTWTITKITRTVELAVLLTVGFLAFGFFVVPLLLIVLLVVLNDLVTLVLGTDKAWTSPAPERWSVRDIAKISAVLATGWLILAFVILWAGLRVLELQVDQVQTIMFVYLVVSAQATIYITRVRDHFWSFAPSRYVIAVTMSNIIVVSLLAIGGVLMAAITIPLLLALLAIIAAATFLLDYAKIRFYRRTGILGWTTKNPLSKNSA